MRPAEVILPLPFYRLIPAPIILKVSGRDCVRYLNARLTNNIKELVAGSLCQGAALSPQGKTQALFTVLADFDNTFTLVCDGGSHDDVIAAFKKFLVADRVEVVDQSSSYQLLHLCMSGEATVPGSPEIANGCVAVKDRSHTFAVVGATVIFTNRRAPHAGYDLLLQRDDAEGVIRQLRNAGWHSLSNEEAKLAAITAECPSFPDELNEEHILTEASLQSVISFQKGCYVGQEVIEKIDAQGKTPKTLKRLWLAGIVNLEIGSEVFSRQSGSEKSVGKILSFAQDPKSGQTFCFASLKNDPAIFTHPLFVGGNQASLL